MGGKGRFGALAVRSHDLLLSALAPLGLAGSVGTALVVDLVKEPRPGRLRTLADIMSEGPQLAELSPGRTGVAVLDAGPIELTEAVEAVETLAERWPAVVVRVDGPWPGPVVPVVPLYPGMLAPSSTNSAVWQRVAGGSSPSGPGPVLPSLRAGLVRQLLSGSLPDRSRWLRAWARVWELPWA